MRIFNAWLDSIEHSAFTGSQASIEPGLGGAHRAFDGYIQGRILELQDGSRIVQSWRTSEFPADSPDSRLEITLEPTLGGTLVTLLHTDIPTGQSDRYRSGWNEFYLSRMKAYFSEAAGKAETKTPGPAQRASTQRASTQRASTKRAPTKPAKRATPKRGKAAAKARRVAKTSKASARKTKKAAPKVGKKKIDRKKAGKKAGKKSSKRRAGRPKRRK
jgi:uncharacterized protein YndB with AHSA1/START domain